MLAMVTNQGTFDVAVAKSGVLAQTDWMTGAYAGDGGVTVGDGRGCRNRFIADLEVLSGHGLG